MSFALLTVNYLEKQLQRAIMINPALADDLNARGDAPAASEDKPVGDEQMLQTNQLASLIQNSTLLKSYEQLMQ